MYEVVKQKESRKPSRKAELGVMEDDGQKGKDAVEPASISFNTRSFDSSCLTAFRDNKLCCPKCYEATNGKSEPEKFDFYVNPDGIHQHFRIQHKNLEVTKDCIIKAKNVTIRLSVTFALSLQNVKVILATHTQK